MSATIANVGAGALLGGNPVTGRWDAAVAAVVKPQVEALEKSLDRGNERLVEVADRVFSWAIVWVVGAVILGLVWADWLMPPPRFDYAPKMDTEVRYRTADVFALYCGTNHPKVGGCAVVKDGVCFITIRQELAKLDRDAVLRHENGHCNGWPANHPGGGTRVASDWGTTRVTPPGDTVFLARQ
jgi:hypothetical protein